MDILIETAKAEDIGFVKALEVECKLASWSIEDYRQEVLDANKLFLIAKNKEENLGFMLARPIMYETDIKPNICHFETEFHDTYHRKIIESEVEIYNIAVKIQYRRSHVASRLIEKLIEIASADNLKKIHLEVRKSNTGAIRFYQRKLFRIVGERKSFYSNPSEDAILLSRTMPAANSIKLEKDTKPDITFENTGQIK